tara:strand:+ start:734 stop:1243 length:510 start_codon:yes stop_codon:yes gene_type:complete
MGTSDDERRGLAPRPRDPETPDWAEGLVRFLDDGLRVPFTDFRFGFDAILGLLPVAGDTVSGVTSLAILGLALKQGVPTVILARMVGNIAIDALVGSIPGLGDLFDFVFKANRKNLDLIERFRQPDAEAGAADYALVGLGILLAVAMVAIPLVVLFWAGGALGEWIRSW